MALNLNAFQEPRGVMRVIQFIFAICAFATVADFSNSIEVEYCENKKETIQFDYPFRLDRINVQLSCFNSTYPFQLYGDFSSDAQFFVATGVLSFLYCIGIAVVYSLFEEVYQTNPLVPMADFILTVLLAVFWLSGSAAWSNGIAGLKSVTDPSALSSLPNCKNLLCMQLSVGSYSTLNVSAILGFANFFLWASDLWFLYKETQWFKNVNAPPAQSPTMGV